MHFNLKHGNDFKLLWRLFTFRKLPHPVLARILDIAGHLELKEGWYLPYVWAIDTYHSFIEVNTEQGHVYFVSATEPKRYTEGKNNQNKYHVLAMSEWLLSKRFCSGNTRLIGCGVVSRKPGPRCNIKTAFSGIDIPIITIRRPWDHFTIILGIPMVVMRHLYI